MDDAYGDLSPQGMLLIFPFRDGSCRVVLYDYARAGAPVTDARGSDVQPRAGRQFRLNTARTRRRRALRWGVQRLAVPLPGVRSWLARNHSGISVRYPVTDGRHPMTGARLPPGHLTLPGGSVRRLYELFPDGRFVLLSPDGVPDGLPGCVKTVRYARCSPRLPALPIPALLWRAGAGVRIGELL